MIRWFLVASLLTTALFLPPAAALATSTVESQVEVESEFHCALPTSLYCIQEYIVWLKGVRGPINLACQLATGHPCVQSTDG